MSMVTSGCRADVVSDEFVRKHCPDELDALNNFLEDNGYTLDDFHMEQSFRDYPTFDEDDKHTKLIALHKALEEKFIAETFLSLYSVFHSKEDKGDELDGGSFAVDGVYVLSEAGKKFKSDITEVAWTTFG